MAKVVIIGAGSLVFSSRLQADILSYENLRDTHFCLVDIDEERLGYAQQITEQIIKRGGYSEALTNLEQAVIEVASAATPSGPMVSPAWSTLSPRAHSRPLAMMCWPGRIM